MQVPTRKHLVIAAATGLLATLVAWVASQLGDDVYLTGWYLATGICTLLLIVSIAGHAVAPEEVFDHSTLTISKAGWEALMTVSVWLVMLLVIVTPVILVIVIVVTRPQTAKSVVPLVFVAIGIATGLCIVRVLRPKRLDFVAQFGIVGTAVTIISAIGFAIAELL